MKVKTERSPQRSASSSQGRASPPPPSAPGTQAIMVETVYRRDECNYGPADEVPELLSHDEITEVIKRADTYCIFQYALRAANSAYELVLKTEVSVFVDHLIRELNGLIVDDDWALLAMRKEDFSKFFLHDGSGGQFYDCVNCRLDDATIRAELMPWMEIKDMTRNVFYRTKNLRPRRKGVIQIIGKRTRRPLPRRLMIQGRRVQLRKPGDFGDNGRTCFGQCRPGAGLEAERSEGRRHNGQENDFRREGREMVQPNVEVKTEEGEEEITQLATGTRLSSEVEGDYAVAANLYLTVLRSSLAVARTLVAQVLNVDEAELPQICI